MKHRKHEFVGQEEAELWAACLNRPRSRRATMLLMQFLSDRQTAVIDQLKRCVKADCDRYFFPKFPAQKYCSIVCQMRDYQNGEKWKEHRRQKWQARQASFRRRA